MRVDLGSYPSMRKTHSVEFRNLAGGLNISELDYRLDPNESPEMRNMWWEEGVLQCRPGQVLVSNLLVDPSMSVRGCFGELFHGCAFIHDGGGIRVVDMTENVGQHDYLVTTPSTWGTFFRYQDSLFFKSKGTFLRIDYDDSLPELLSRFSVSSVASATKAFVPTILINADPATAAGDLYQPENRISAKKKVTYNVTKADTSVFKLPVKNIDSIESVAVNGTATTAYTASLVAGTVTLNTPVQPTNPITNNTVAITYSKANPDAVASVMDCEYATVGGGDDGLCILLAGCDAQPNAVFWNSNDQFSMNPSYWPADSYNLVGDTSDPVTGFGKQYSTLVVLKEHSVGKLNFGVETVDGLNSISFTYETINSKTGCDLPNSIQLIENNLVFANTYQGVHVIRAASAAYENNVECISHKINGSVLRQEKTGLKNDLMHAEHVTSFDDDQRYWLCVDDKVYVWDYTISTYSNPSWFYFTNINAAGFFVDGWHNLYNVSRDGYVLKFDRVFTDYSPTAEDHIDPIDKFYRFPTQFFGGYERQKDVDDIYLALRSDTDTDVKVTYTTDFEVREDLVPVQSFSWRLCPRNLTHRSLRVSRFAAVARRRPACKQIRHFTLTLSNNAIGEDLAIVSLQINYRYRIKER